MDIDIVQFQACKDYFDLVFPDPEFKKYFLEHLHVLILEEIAAKQSEAQAKEPICDYTGQSLLIPLMNKVLGEYFKKP